MAAFIRAFLIFSNLFIITSSFCFSEEKNASSEIAALLNAVKNSGYVYYRNEKSYSSQEAFDFFSLKAKHFSKDGIETAENFIDEIATRSSQSGRPYEVEIEGQRINLSDYLYSELKKIRGGSLQTQAA